MKLLTLKALLSLLPIKLPVFGFTVLVLYLAAK